MEFQSRSSRGPVEVQVRSITGSSTRPVKVQQRFSRGPVEVQEGRSLVQGHSRSSGGPVGPSRGPVWFQCGSIRGSVGPRRGPVGVQSRSSRGPGEVHHGVQYRPSRGPAEGPVEVQESRGPTQAQPRARRAPVEDQWRPSRAIQSRPSISPVQVQSRSSRGEVGSQESSNDRARQGKLMQAHGDQCSGQCGTQR